MATWEYGPIKVSEDWGDCYKNAIYSMKYFTVSDTMCVIRTFEGKTEELLYLGRPAANAVAKLLAQWLYNYEDEKEFLKAPWGKEDE